MSICEVCGRKVANINARIIRGASGEWVCRECLKKAHIGVMKFSCSNISSEEIRSRICCEPVNEQNLDCNNTSIFGFQSKKKLQARAIDLLENAQIAAESANKEKYIEFFIQDYEEMLECFREIVEITKKVKLKGISGNPELDYYTLKNEFQWHMRDALEREYDTILGDASSKYRNNRRMVEASYNNFQEDIRRYSSKFDDETTIFANELLRKLSSKLNIAAVISHEDEKLCIQADFDSLEGHQFEYWCATLLKKNGFSNVEVTQGSGDQGVDIIAEKDEIRYAIQCKCYSSNLGNTPIQEVYAGKNMYRCQIGVVMTNRYFTKGAYELAMSTGVLLWDRDRLLKMLDNAQ